VVDVVERVTNTEDGDAMTENSRIVAVVKGQLSKFSGIISKGLPKAKQRLVREMLYGIQAGKDVKLSSITRSLNGHPADQDRRSVIEESGRSGFH